jgi:ribose/xylose/arabinose/galactoside ABC-type transport system permease subunit
MSVEATQLTTRLGGLSPDRLFFIVSRLVALILLVTALSLLSPYFLTWPNFINVMRQAAY